MATRGCDTGFCAVAFDVVLNSRRLARLWIDELNIRDIDKRFLINNASAPVCLRVSSLVTLDHADAFNFDFSLCGHHFEHAPTSTFVPPGYNYNLVVLFDLRAFCSCHNFKSPPAPATLSS